MSTTWHGSPNCSVPCHDRRPVPPGKDNAVNRKSLPVALLTLALLAACARTPGPGPAAALDGLAADLQSKLDAVRLESGFPGATLAVVLADGREIHLASGVSDPASGAPMKPTDIMFSGSTGKTFVAGVALQLVDEGELALDLPISRFFGGTAWLERLPNHDRITVRHLLSHTSGLPRYVEKTVFWEDLAAEPDRVWQPLELLAYIFDEPPVHPAGDGWAYSDTNFIVLGMIIEQITGNTVYEEVERRFIAPLGLTRTAPSTSRRLPGLIQGCSGDSPMFDFPAHPLVDGVYFINPQFEWTGGGFVSNVLDLARWLGALLGGDLLSEATRREMQRPADQAALQAEGESYGLGLQIWTSPSGLVYGHGGIFPGHQTQIEYSSAHDFCLALQINADRFSGLLDRSMHEYAGQFMPLVASWALEQAD